MEPVLCAEPCDAHATLIPTYRCVNRPHRQTRKQSGGMYLLTATKGQRGCSRGPESGEGPSTIHPNAPFISQMNTGSPEKERCSSDPMCSRLNFQVSHPPYCLILDKGGHSWVVVVILKGPGFSAVGAQAHGKQTRSSCYGLYMVLVGAHG